MYGADDVVEDALAAVEGRAATVLSAVMRNLDVPAAGTSDRDILVTFLALQLTRTLAARVQTELMSQALGDAAFDGKAPSEFTVGPDEAIAMLLAAAPEMARTLGDLTISLVRAAPATAFLTSDNPAFKYNSYCEGTKDFGVTGTTCRGFQLFLPLSPSLLLHAYDGGVYKVGSRRSSVVVARQEDVQSLNRLQFMSADDNVYYRDWSATDECRKMAKTVQRLREQSRPRVNKAVDDQDASSQLLHQYWPMPQLALRLSFLRLQRNARRVPLAARARLARGRYQSTDQAEESWTGKGRRFVVRKRY